MNVILIITGLGMGGAERQTCDLADQFIRLGHQVLLISMTGKSINRPQSDAVKVVELNMAKTPCGFMRAYWRARELISHHRPDVVHSHMVHANIFARLLRLSVRVPKLICTAHSSNEGGYGRMLAYRLTDRLCDLSTNVSQEAVDIFVARGASPASRIIAMHNGIDTERFTFNTESRHRLRKELNFSTDTPLILAVGRLTEAKDYPNLLRAFRRISEAYNGVQLAIIGSGEELANLTAMVAELGLKDRVHLLGLRHNVHEWMSAADLFVLSSAWEGFGLVVAEAMACERVVVVTDCGGVKEVIGDCGILVPAKNSAALAQGLVKGLTLNSDLVQVQGLFARQRILDCYSLSAQAERWLVLYK